MAERRRRRPALLAAAWAACAASLGCAFTEAGDGSGTLQVVGTFRYVAGERDQNTTVAVTVSRQGAAVPANVKVVDVDTGEAYEIGGVAGSGSFAGALPGYRRHLQLRVHSAADFLRARLEAPGPTSLRAPQAGATHVASDATAVVWRADDGLRADEVTVAMEQDGYVVTLPDDPGQAHIAAGRLGVGADTLVLTRRTQVVPAGGAPHSLLRAEYVVRAAYQRI